MDLKDLNYWLLIVAIVSIIYLLIKAWHEYFSNIHQNECTLCDSKKFKRIHRSKFYRIIPFTSKKYFCKNCDRSYLIIQIFNKKYTIYNGPQKLNNHILKNDLM